MPTPAQARAQMTVPETPSSAMAATAQVLQQRLKQVSLAAGAPGGPGRFEDNTPSRRATKSRRVALQGAGGGLSAWLRVPCAVVVPDADSHALVYMSFNTWLTIRDCNNAFASSFLAKACSDLCPVCVRPPYMAIGVPSLGAAFGGPAGGASASSDDVLSVAESLFRKIRCAVAMQYAPSTLKSTFLDPMHDRLALEVALELFARSDAEFGAMFSGALGED